MATIRKNREEDERGGSPFPLEMQGPIRCEGMTEALPRYTAGGDDIESGAALRETNHSKHDEALRFHLPEGSVYTWAARLDGAHTSDAIVGWIVLLVSVCSCRL